MKSSTSLWYERMHREHAEFRRSVAAVHAAVRAAGTGPGAVGSDCVRVEFESYSRCLRRYFAEEERSDPFRRECVATAAARRWAERTVAAHRDLEARLDELAHVLDGPTDPSRLEERLRTLIDELFEHELAEERLVQRLVFEPSGGLDPAL